MATIHNSKWLKWASIAILVFFGLTIMTLITMPLVEKERIFSNIFVDSYKPRKVFIHEKAPVRIIFFGETNEVNATQLSMLIRELNKVKFQPGYRLNDRTEIEVFSRLIGDRNRKSSHVVTDLSTASVAKQPPRPVYPRPVYRDADK